MHGRHSPSYVRGYHATFLRFSTCQQFGAESPKDEALRLELTGVCIGKCLALYPKFYANDSISSSNSI